MKTKGKFYRIGNYEGNSLWLADDATLVASSKKDVEDNKDTDKIRKQLWLKFKQSKNKGITCER